MRLVLGGPVIMDRKGHLRRLLPGLPVSRCFSAFKEALPWGPLRPSLSGWTQLEYQFMSLLGQRLQSTLVSLLCTVPRREVAYHTQGAFPLSCCQQLSHPCQCHHPTCLRLPGPITRGEAWGF
ncbi:hypothetical protein mRhiFer1_007924 [Rhinolophus ferrumequinum]|uniref:Uncharacterized protein n=1 Tax=Rhinolophus ferrumequinum TaxID=59479 RepID=A0A7J8AVB0_RHIFE|nr:hypothetical protein mRhiFer1_007924 [Rhinolophus ferrumequinum]